MDDNPQAMKDRTKKFALAVLEFVRTLPVNVTTQSISRQLVRAATSVGANYRSACRSRSRAEFIARIGIVLEEVDESAFWLEILTEGRLAASRGRALALLDEANQLTAIMAASSITASHNRDAN